MNDVQTGVGEVPAYISFPCEGPLLRCRGPSDCTFHPSSRNGSVESGFGQRACICPI